MHAASKYGNNTKGGEEELNCNLKFHNEGISYKGSALFHHFHVSSIKRYEMIS